MSKHTYEYSHSIWGLAQVVCRSCKKKLGEWESQFDDTECTVEITEDTGYTEGFSFEGKSDAEVRQILSSGNRDYLGRER